MYFSNPVLRFALEPSILTRGTTKSTEIAENLGWIAEEWWSRGADGRFTLEVLNMTGILSRPLLEQRMRLFL